jgi:hypothetical protein
MGCAFVLLGFVTSSLNNSYQLRLGTYPTQPPALFAKGTEECLDMLVLFIAFALEMLQQAS